MADWDNEENATGAPNPRRFDRAVPLLLIACLAWVCARGVVFRDTPSGDDAYMATEAWNILRSSEFWLRNTVVPAGSGDWVHDVAHMGHTPIHATLLALGVLLAFGHVWGLGVFPLAGMAICLACMYRIALQRGREPAMFAVLLFASTPAIMEFFTSLDLDPSIAPFGLLSTLVVMRADRDDNLWYYLLAGWLLGFCFLIKLWMCAPYVLSIGALCLASFWRAGFRTIGRYLVFTLGFFLGASSHLAVVAAASTGDLSVWLRSVYFGILTGEGASGGKWSGVAAYPEWSHPFWYYGAILVRDHFVALAVLILGLPTLVRRGNCNGASQAILVCLGGLAALIPLSLFSIKEPFYILPAMPFFYILAALSFSSWLQSIQDTALNRIGRLWSICVLLGTALVPAMLVLAYALGKSTDDLTGPYLLRQTLTVWTVFLFGLWALRKPSAVGYARAGIIPLVAVVALVTLLGGEPVNEESPGKRVARTVAPALASRQAHEVSFIAPQLPELQFWLYRQGITWGEYFDTNEDDRGKLHVNLRDIDVVILDPKMEGKPEMALITPLLEAQYEIVSSAQPPELATAGPFGDVYIRRGVVPEQPLKPMDPMPIRGGKPWSR